MRVVGITAEYDPMHTGHIYHLGEARAVSTADFVVAVMSGDFTQRGEPALLDKWTRAKIAAENGIDLVLELPFAYACNSAEYFAFGAMEIMKRLGVVTHVAFGAESQDLQQLQGIADLLRAEMKMPGAGRGAAARETVEAEKVAVYREALRRELAAGRSFAAARGAAIEECLGPAAGTAAAAPNNLLAIEYLKFAGDMTPVLIPRTAPHNYSLNEEHPPVHSMSEAVAAKKRWGSMPDHQIPNIPESAGAIRELVLDLLYRPKTPDGTKCVVNAGNASDLLNVTLSASLINLKSGAQFVDRKEALEEILRFAPLPETSKNAIRDAAFPTEHTPKFLDSGFLCDRENVFGMLMSKLLTMTVDDLARIFSVTEGMENRILDARRRCSDMESLIEAIKTKRYPYTSISRMLMHTLVGFEKRDLRAPDDLYGHILAASANGRKLLRILKDDPRCMLPLFGTVERDQAGSLLALDIRAADLYNQATGRDLYRESDYVKHPYMGS